MKVRLNILIVLCLTAGKIYTQSYQPNYDIIEELIEEIAQGSEHELDYSQITDDLYYYLSNPLNLNTASTEELSKLYVLNDFQILSLQNYLAENGKMLTIYELQLIEGFNYAAIKKILPFVKVSASIETESWKLSEAMKYGNSTVFGRFSSLIQVPEGYKNPEDTNTTSESNNYYLGNRARVYTRYKFNYQNKLQWGITAEKDPGEELFTKSQTRGFDFYSVHLQVNDIGILKTALLGDFQAQFGQGLIMWSAIGSGKSSFVMNVKKRGKGLHRYSSTNENSFFRGAGFTIEKYDFSLSSFASYKAIDANVKNDTTTNSEYFSSFQNTGIHATPTQLANKDAVKENVFGANLSWQKRMFKIGISGIHYSFDKPLIIDDNPKNVFSFSGSSNSNISCDAELKFKKLHLFSEAAVSANGGKALIIGSLMKLSSQLQTSILYRNYEKDYQAHYGNAFAEGSGTKNEEGLYFGVKLYPIKKWHVSAYYDMYRFPWLTYYTSSPSRGNDMLVQAEFVASENLSMYWRYKSELKEKDNNESQLRISDLAEISKRQIRYQVAYSPLINWQFRNRIELSLYEKENNDIEQGYILFQDVIYKPNTLPFALTFRYAVFDTEDYNTRIYTFENDVLYAYSVPALYNEGTRVYIILHYKLANKLDFWIRYSNTWYVNKTEIGSGNDLILDNTKSEIKLQFRLKF